MRIIIIVLSAGNGKIILGGVAVMLLAKAVDRFFPFGICPGCGLTRIKRSKSCDKVVLVSTLETNMVTTTVTCSTCGYYQGFSTIKIPSVTRKEETS